MSSGTRVGRPLGGFWPKVDKNGPTMPGMSTPCWPWTAYTSDDGYGQFGVDGKICKAHVVAWEEVNGPVPDGLQLDHLCRLRRCVRPDHLEPVTSRENTLRGDTLAAKYLARVSCSNGHPFDSENTIIRPDGARRCRACLRAYQRNWISRKRSESVI